MSESCERCRRTAPPMESPEYVSWEAIERGDGTVGIICPGCLTGVEEQELDEAVMDVEAELDEQALDAAAGTPQRGPAELN